MKKIRMAVLAGAFSAVAFSAGAIPAVTITGDFPGQFAGFNNFIDELDTALGGPPTFADELAFVLNTRSRLTFTAVAAESGRQNNFTVDRLGTLSEPANNLFGEGTDFMTSGGLGSLSGTFEAGSLDSLFRFTSTGFATVGSPGTAFLGVYLPGGAASGDQFSKFFLAFDDGARSDDDHDDFLVRVDVTAIPLPASVLLLLAALGGLGVVSRRRRSGP